MNNNNKLSILIVDDEKSFRYLVRKAFEEDGLEVIEAESGTQALSIIKECIPDVILLDIAMPEMDGFEVCTKIRRIPNAEKVPVVMLTGQDDLISIRKAYEVGVTDYISKPVIWPWPVLNHRIKSILEGNQAKDDSQLHKSRFEHIEEAIGLGYWQLNCDDQVFEYNQKWADILNIHLDSDFNYEPDFLKRINLHDIFSFKESVNKVIETGEPIAIQIRIKQGDGLYQDSFIWVEVTCAVLEWDDHLQKAKQVCGTLRQIIMPESSTGPLDIERKITRETIQQRDLYQAVISTLQDVVIILDDKNKIMSMNQAALTLFGIKSNEPLIAEIKQYIPEIGLIVPLFDSNAEQAFDAGQEQEKSYQFTGKTESGESIQLNAQINRFQWNDGVCCSIVIRNS